MSATTKTPLIRLYISKLITSTQHRHITNKATELRFDGRSAIVTGGGRGLGRQYALLLASRGAKVVVNDFGGAIAGGESSSGKESAAAKVVEEIKFLGGEAVADQNSVASERGAQTLVERCMSSFGRVDILINNAGNLRDKSFSKMTIEDFDQVIGTHLRGSFLVSHFCWPLMEKQNYGKILMTSSTSGIYGNFGQANYAAAKLGLVGLAQTLAIEGQRRGIGCNAIVPMAASRMTEKLLPNELANRLKPDYVAPLACWLCHETCDTSGGIFEAAGRWYGRHRLFRSTGAYLSEVTDFKLGSKSNNRSLEVVAENWSSIGWLDGSAEQATQVQSFADHLGELVQTFEKSDKSGKH